MTIHLVARMKPTGEAMAPFLWCGQKGFVEAVYEAALSDCEDCMKARSIALSSIKPTKPEVTP